MILPLTTSNVVIASLDGIHFISLERDEQAHEYTTANSDHQKDYLPATA
jgi:hypothetical protein